MSYIGRQPRGRRVTSSSREDDCAGSAVEPTQRGKPPRGEHRSPARTWSGSDSGMRIERELAGDHLAVSARHHENAFLEEFRKRRCAAGGDLSCTGVGRTGEGR